MLPLKINLIFLNVIILGAFTFAAKCPVVKISTGEIQGVDKESRNDRPFCVYRAIPYAKPPIGELRFEPPLPASNWTGVKKLDDYGSVCVQYSQSKDEVVGKEDCLFINVFSPLFANGFSRKQLSVIVFIHGGYFMMGSADNYRPHYFMDEDVVFVTFNYRLGAFGFLNTEDGFIRGNMGLKDQVMALQWVQRNIRDFSGNPDSVTIMGQSAGGAAVHYHLLSPMSKGLFHKAISQSGSAIKPWSFQTKPREAAFNLAKLLDCNKFLNASTTAERWEENGTSLLLCLKKADSSQIANIYKEASNTIKNKLFKLGPTVEVGSKFNDTFLTEHPYSIMISGRQQRIPWIQGTTSEEGLAVTARIIHDSDLMSMVETNWTELSPTFLQYNPYRTDITDRIRGFYLSNSQQILTLTESRNGTKTVNISGSETPAAINPADNNAQISFAEKFSQFTNLFTDRLYSFGPHKTIQIQSKYSPVYVYYYNYKGEYSFANALEKKKKEDTLKKATNWFKTKVLGRTIKEPDHMGVSHSDELLLLFKYPDAKIKSDAKDFQTSRDLVKLWVQFSVDEKLMKFGDATWTPVKVNATGAGVCLGGSTEIYNVLRISNSKAETGMVRNPIIDRMNFWDSLEYLTPYKQ